MPDLIRYPVPFWIAQKLHYVSRPPPSRGQARGKDGRRVINRRSNNINQGGVSGRYIVRYVNWPMPLVLACGVKKIDRLRHYPQRSNHSLDILDLFFQLFQGDGHGCFQFLSIYGYLELLDAPEKVFQGSSFCR